MAMRHVNEKPVVRYRVVDDGLTFWAVLDTYTGKIVRDTLRDEFSARMIVEELERNDKGE